MRYIALLPLTLIALFFSSVITVTSAHAECRPFKVSTTEIIGSTRKRAEQRARGAWERKVRRLSGIDNAWHDWGNAMEHELKCRKKLGTHRCRAIARPCTRSRGGAPRMICENKPTTGPAGKAATTKRAKKEPRGLWEKKTTLNWGEAQDHHYDCRKKGKHRYYCNGIARRCWRP